MAAEKVDQAFAQNSSINGTTGKIPVTLEGMAIAFGSLVIMALLSIFVGAFRSVNHHKERKTNKLESYTIYKPYTMTRKDAAMFPIKASCVLFGLYLFLQPSQGYVVTKRNVKLSLEHIFSNEDINLFLTLLGISALFHLLSPVMTKLLPTRIPNTHYHIHYSRNLNENEEPTILFYYKFSTYDIICLAFCSVVGVWYIVTKHWIANNLFGMAFAITTVELFHINNVGTGCILLGGILIYDIFWVFGTNVMVTVAKSVEAPIKLVFPQDFLENGLAADNFAMLGLGDIILPGIFIALLLRFDNHLSRNSRTYFNISFLAYIAGIFITFFVLHKYRHAQPAMLYLVPACVGAPLFLALVKGDIKAMFQYEDEPSEDKEKSKSDDATSKKTK